MASLLALLRRIANMCHKEFLAVMKDPATRAILIVPALVQSMLFGYAATFDLTDAPYVLADQDRGAAARDYVARLEGGGVFRRVATLAGPQDIAPLIASHQAMAAIVIAPDFERRLQAGTAAPIQLIVDGRNSNTAGAAAGHVAAVTAAFNQAWRARHGATTANAANAAAMPPVVDTRAWYNPNLQTRWNILPGLVAGLSMLQTLLLSALSVAREREHGSFDQLLVTLLWFRVPMAGSPLTLYAGLALFTVASVGIGLSISAVSLNMQQAMLYTFVLIMPLMLLSGLTTPVRNMPQLMQTLTLANPLRFAIDLVQRVYLEGVGLRVVAGDLLPLAIMAAITLPLAAWLFRHRLA